jgi:hypothetical protein
VIHKRKIPDVVQYQSLRTIKEGNRPIKLQPTKLWRHDEILQTGRVAVLENLAAVIDCFAPGPGCSEQKNRWRTAA